MKKIINKKLKAFSLAYAIVSLVLVAIAVAGATPILTRKLANINALALISGPGNVKGWYESYNAPDVGTPYCKTCMANDKEGKPWSDIVYDGIITKEEAGNPIFNPYVKDFDKDLVPFEKYCSGKGKCGYPKEKWDEDELLSPNSPDEHKPHKCKSSGCKFKPTKNIVDFQLYAIGSGGASGSAVADKKDKITATKDENGNLKKDLIGKHSLSSSEPLAQNSSFNVSDDKYKIEANFIDVYKIKDNDGNFNKASAKGEFFTVAENRTGDEKIKADHIQDNGANEIQGNFQSYPTQSWNKKLANNLIASSKQVKKILEDNNKHGLTNKDNIIHRFYLYTKTVGADTYQTPEYTLMPEWLKMDGNEKRYPCPEFGFNCLPEPELPPAGGTPPITQTYNRAVAVGCSGDGGNGGSANNVCTNSPCGWMIPKGCPAKEAPKYEVINAHGDNVGCGGSCDGQCPAGTNTTYDSYGDCVNKECRYDNYFYSRKCTYDTYKSAYVTCTCDNIPLPDRCKDQADAMAICTPVTATVSIDPNSVEDIQALQDYYQQAVENGTKFAVTTSLGQHVEGAAYIPDTSEAYAEVSARRSAEVVDAMSAAGQFGTAVSNFVRSSAIGKYMSNAQLSAAGNSLFGALGAVKGALGGMAEMEIGIAGGAPHCSLNTRYCRSANGGGGGVGRCVYRYENVKRKELKSITNIGTPDAAAGSDHSSCGVQHDGSNADPANACINGSCIIATAATGGKGGVVSCGVCGSSVHNGSHGTSSKVQGATTNAGSFEKSEIGASESLGKGSKKDSGRYNWHYIWYMPVVTKHLMFGEAGKSGQELKEKVTLNEENGDYLEVHPGKVVKKTDYKSGEFGKDGNDTKVLKKQNNDTQKTYTAGGGKGGKGSIKTEQYLLCNVVDKQGDNINYPCYYKSETENDYKKTHKFIGGKLTGLIGVINPKQADKIKNIPMSEELRKANPGLGGMGFGTESVSDFICEKRHVDKIDDASKTDVLKQGGIADNLCNGNSKIKYILPNGTGFAPGTGIVIVSWQ